MAADNTEKLEKGYVYTIKFRNREHKDFYKKYLAKCRFQDVYHKALVYCIGIDQNTRDHVENIYDFKTGFINSKCMQEGWQTSGSKKIVRMAFNLYGNGTPSAFVLKGRDRQSEECQCYGVASLCSAWVELKEGMDLIYACSQ